MHKVVHCVDATIIGPLPSSAVMLEYRYEDIGYIPADMLLSHPLVLKSLTIAASFRSW